MLKVSDKVKIEIPNYREINTNNSLEMPQNDELIFSFSDREVEA